MGPDLDQNDPRIRLYIAQRGMNPDAAGVEAAKSLIQILFLQVSTEMHINAINVTVYGI